MAYDEGSAQVMRDALGHLLHITERKMFGGLCFMYQGNMLCGVHNNGAMFRVGKENESEALNVPLANPMSFTGRKMGGMIETDSTVFEREKEFKALLDFSLAFVSSLPPK